MPTTVLPPVLVVNKIYLERVFKLLIKKLISENKLDFNDLMEINKFLKVWMITGMQTVDFADSYNNNKVLDELIDELWTEFYKDLNMRVKKYRTKFKRKSL